MVDLLAGRPFELSPSIGNLTAAADQEARDQGLGGDDPADLAGDPQLAQPRHRPGILQPRPRTTAALRRGRGVCEPVTRRHPPDDAGNSPTSDGIGWPTDGDARNTPRPDNDRWPDNDPCPDNDLWPDNDPWPDNDRWPDNDPWPGDDDSRWGDGDSDPWPDAANGTGGNDNWVDGDSNRWPGHDDHDPWPDDAGHERPGDGDAGESARPGDANTAAATMATATA
jgi:hypothetical protein